MIPATTTQFDRITIDNPREDLERRISRLQGLAMTIDDPEAAARMTDFILGLEFELLAIT